MVSERLQEMNIGFETRSKALSDRVPTLVMLHGAGGCSQGWQNQTRFLSDSLNTLAFDLPGHGKTEEPAKASVEEYAKWLGKTIEALFQKPVFLMGHSFGGAIVQKTALSCPHLLKGIILVATGPRLKVAPLFLQGLLDNFEQTVDSIIEFAYAPGADSSMIKEGARLMKDAGPGVVHGDFLACDRFDLRNEVEGIQHPCLIICGDQDKLTPVSLSESLNRSIRGSSLEVIPSSGHMVMIEKHKAFNDHVLDFIEMAQEGPSPPTA